MHRYITEFIGTFFLVLVIGLSVIGTQPVKPKAPEASAAVMVTPVKEMPAIPSPMTPVVPLAIGAILMVMIFMGGHISGAHFNPAVTLAVFLRGKLPAKDVIPYWIAQFAAGVVAALLAKYVIMGDGIHGEPVAAEKIVAALVVEFVFTFALALVVLNVATAPGTSGNSFYGLAIGFTVVAGAIAGGGISGGAFNPAVGVGITLMGVPAANIWLYFVGPLAGGAAAAAVYKIQHPDEAK